MRHCFGIPHNHSGYLSDEITKFQFYDLFRIREMKKLDESTLSFGFCNMFHDCKQDELCGCCKDYIRYYLLGAAERDGLYKYILEKSQSD